MEASKALVSYRMFADSTLEMGSAGFQDFIDTKFKFHLLLEQKYLTQSAKMEFTSETCNTCEMGKKSLNDYVKGDLSIRHKLFFSPQ